MKENYRGQQIKQDPNNNDKSYLEVTKKVDT